MNSVNAPMDSTRNSRQMISFLQDDKVKQKKSSVRKSSRCYGKDRVNSTGSFLVWTFLISEDVSACAKFWPGRFLSAKVFKLVRSSEFKQRSISSQATNAALKFGLICLTTDAN